MKEIRINYHTKPSLLTFIRKKCAILAIWITFLVLLYVSSTFLYSALKIKEEPSLSNQQNNGKRNGISPVFALVICGENNGKKTSFKNSSQRQIEQAFVLIKSAVLLTQKIITFVILVDGDGFFNMLLEKLNQWPEKIRAKLVLKKRKIWYPEAGNLKELFRLCATERLFLLKALPSEDSVVYLDTDMIFLKPPEHLWEEFSRFNSVHLSGIAPSLTYYNPKLKFPYYGKTGLNSGVWMMNLTRMKIFPGGWTETCLEVYDEYKTSLVLHDQDIANIIFSKNPWFLHELDCQWNYRNSTCFFGENRCKEAESNGIFLLHGNGGNFYSDLNQKFKTLFKQFLHFDVNHPLEEFLQSLKTSLKKVDFKINKTKCANLSNIDDLLTKSLENSINVLTKK